MGTDPTGRSTTPPLLALLVALLASACGDDPQPPATPAASTAAPAAAPAPASTTAPPTTASAPQPAAPATTIDVPALAPATPVDEAIRQLRSAGLVPAVSPVPLSFQRRPVVRRSDPAGGVPVAVGSSVRLVAAPGGAAGPTCPAAPPGATGAMPRLVGRSLADTARVLAGAGYVRWLIVGGLPEVRALPPDIAYLSAFVVTAQDRAAGTPLPRCGDPVGLAVALAPLAGGLPVAPAVSPAPAAGAPAVRVPALPPTRTSVDGALALLGQRGLVARVPAWRRLSSRRGAPMVVGFEPPAGRRVPAGGAVELRLRPGPPGARPRCAAGPIDVPDVLALDLADAIAALDAVGVAWRVDRLPALAPERDRVGLLASYVVTTQEPGPSRAASCATTVRLAVRPAPAAGTSLVPRIPPFSSVQRAARLLRRAGLTATVSAGHASALAAPAVQRTRPGPYRVLPRGAHVELVMGAGPLASPVCYGSPEMQVAAPSLVGLRLDQAAEALDQLTVGWDVAGSLPPLPAVLPPLPAVPPDVPYLAAFVVTGQSPPPGTAVRRCQTPEVHLTARAAPG